MGKPTDKEKVEKIIRYSKENPNLTQEEVGYLCGVSTTVVGNVMRINKALETEKLTSVTKYFNTNATLVAAVAERFGMTLEQVKNKAYGQKEDEPEEITETKTQSTAQQDGLFYVKVLQGVACLPEILNAINNMSDKITVLNQRQSEIASHIDGQVADIAEAQELIAKKMIRVANSLSKFDNSDSEMPTRVIDVIDSGFSDVCGKLDTVRYKLEKAVKTGGK